MWTPSNVDSIMLGLDTNDYVHISWGFEDEELFLSMYIQGIIQFDGFNRSSASTKAV